MSTIKNLEIGEVTQTKIELFKLVKRIAFLYGLKYEKGAEWLGTFGPMLSFVRGFTFNNIEARVGVDKVQLGNQGGVLAATYVSNYVLGVGMSYPPTLKSNLPNTLGPAVSLIQLIRTPHKYQDKWKRVVKRHISHIPDSDAIIDTLVRAKTAAECRSMVKMVLDILLLTTPRTTNRAFIPAAMMTCHVLKAPFNSAAAGTDEAWPLVDVSFSGVKAAAIFNSARELLSYKCHDAEVGAQMVFHGVWRSHNENLDLLKWMTGTDFKHRSSIGALLQNKNSAPIKKLTLPAISKFSKLATACQTDLLVQNRQHMHHDVVFAGHRTIQYSDTLLEFMKREMDTKMLVSEASLLQKLQLTKKVVLEKIERTGRASWFVWKADSNNVYRTRLWCIMERHHYSCPRNRCVRQDSIVVFIIYICYVLSHYFSVCVFIVYLQQPQLYYILLSYYLIYVSLFICIRRKKNMSPPQI